MPRLTSASKSSAASRLFEPAAAAAIAAVIAILALRAFLAHDWLLWFPDAQPHLNTARRILDSRTPGYDQIGTVWLPLPHFAAMPLIENTEWWRTGLAGGIPSMCAFVIASLFLFLAVRRLFSSSAAAFAALALFASNPNVLYMSSTPMTEPYFFASFFGLLYFTVLARQTGSVSAAAAAGVFGCAGALSRYEGWFVLPFAALYLLTSPKHRFTNTILFCAIAGAGPVWWAAHHWWLTGDPLAFYRNEYSAKAIYQRSLAAGMAPYRGDHEWGNAILYFSAAARLNAGPVLAFLGLAGLVACCLRRVFWPVILLVLPPLFYVWSVYSAGTPIFVPHLWPSSPESPSYYNTRYGLAALPLLVLGAAALVALIPGRWKLAAAFVIPLACAAPWILSPTPDSWICWKEAQYNSRIDREWSRQTAEYLREHYKGGGIFTSYGRLNGVFQEAGIPLRETLNECNSPHWYAAIKRPDLFLFEEWAVAVSGDPVATALLRAQKNGPRFDCVKMIVVRGGPVIEIYRRGSRSNAYSLPEGSRGR